MSQRRTLPCPRCQNEIEEGVPRCPHCGADFQPQKKSNTWVVVLLVFLAYPVLACGSCFVLTIGSFPSGNTQNADTMTLLGWLLPIPVIGFLVWMAMRRRD